MLKSAIGALYGQEGNACVVGLGKLCNALIIFGAFTCVLVKCSNANIRLAVCTQYDLAWLQTDSYGKSGAEARASLRLGA